MCDSKRCDLRLAICDWGAPRRAIITSPVSGWDIEKIFQKTKERFLTQDQTTDLPDGSYLFERASTIGFSLDYEHRILNTDGRYMCTKTFADPDLQDLKNVFYLKEISDPVRFEFWVENIPRHCAGRSEAAYVNDINQQVMDYLTAKSKE